MSDRELGDIGLLRSDLYACSALPRDQDPGRTLAQVRAARAQFVPARRGGAPKAVSPFRGERAEASPALARPSDVSLALWSGFGRSRAGDGEEGTRLVGV